jgi:hypothetical protein
MNGPVPADVAIRVTGVERSLSVDTRTSLLDLLREMGKAQLIAAIRRAG